MTAITFFRRRRDGLLACSCTIGIVLALAAALPVSADVELSALGQTELLDFQSFAGAGLKPGGGDGTLDSNDWAVFLFSDQSFSEADFGSTQGAGEFGRGLSPGGVGGVDSVGVYAFETGAGNRALGFQIGPSDFSGGVPSLRVKNSTGVVVDHLQVSYDVWVYNDSNNSNYFDLEFSNGTDFIDPVLYDTPEAADAPPGWMKVEQSYDLFLPIQGYNGTTIDALANGDTILIEWSIGGGFDMLNGYDEVALDNIRITAVPEPTALVLAALGVLGLLGFHRRRTCSYARQSVD